MKLWCALLVSVLDNAMAKREVGAMRVEVDAFGESHDLGFEGTNDKLEEKVDEKIAESKTLDREDLDDPFAVEKAEGEPVAFLDKTDEQENFEKPSYLRPAELALVQREQPPTSPDCGPIPMPAKVAGDSALTAIVVKAEITSYRTLSHCTRGDCHLDRDELLTFCTWHRSQCSLTQQMAIQFAYDMDPWKWGTNMCALTGFGKSIWNDHIKPNIPYIGEQIGHVINCHLNGTLSDCLADKFDEWGNKILDVAIDKLKDFIAEHHQGDTTWINTIIDRAKAWFIPVLSDNAEWLGEKVGLTIGGLGLGKNADMKDFELPIERVIAYKDQLLGDVSRAACNATSISCTPNAQTGEITMQKHGMKIRVSSLTLAVYKWDHSKRWDGLEWVDFNLTESMLEQIDAHKVDPVRAAGEIPFNDPRNYTIHGDTKCRKINHSRLPWSKICYYCPEKQQVWNTDFSETWDGWNWAQIHNDIEFEADRMRWSPKQPPLSIDPNLASEITDMRALDLAKRLQLSAAFAGKLYGRGKVRFSKRSQAWRIHDDKIWNFDLVTQTWREATYNTDNGVISDLDENMIWEGYAWNNCETERIIVPATDDEYARCESTENTTKFL